VLASQEDPDLKLSVTGSCLSPKPLGWWAEHVREARLSLPHCLASSQLHQRPEGKSERVMHTRSERATQTQPLHAGRHCAGCFSTIISLNPHNTSLSNAYISRPCLKPNQTKMKQKQRTEREGKKAASSESGRLGRIGCGRTASKVH
jgi:hypothetical protein